MHGPSMICPNVVLYSELTSWYFQIPNMEQLVVAPRAKHDFCEQQANLAQFKAGAQCLKLKLQYGYNAL